MIPVRSAAALQKEIRFLIKTGNLDAALRRIHGVVEQVFFEPINTAQIFGSRLLDDLCQEIGAIHWRRVREDAIPGQPGEQGRSEAGNLTVYIVSKLYASGGHTLALADIIRLSPHGRSVILMTGVVGATHRTTILKRFHSIPNLSVEYAPRGSHLLKLDWLQRRIQALAPNSIWLFNHHQDSVAVAAIQPDAGYRVHFYHHGDHHLCLGVHLEYAEHIDMHPMGFHNCRNALGIRGNRYLPLVAKDLGDRQVPTAAEQARGLVTCTAASSSKVEAPYFVGYAEVVPELLRATGGRHIHIGHLSQMSLVGIRRGLHRLNIPQAAFVHIPYVPSLWISLQDHQVDLYVASFPYGGARTLIEAMGAGTAVALHAHHSSRLLSTFDMAYKGAFFWRTPDELLEYLRNVGREELRRQSRLARSKFVECHRETLLAEALADSAHMPQAPDLRTDYAPDEFQRALDISSQITCSGVARRHFRRLLARLKSSLG